MGVKYFEELTVDGTGFTQEEKDNAIEKATGEMVYLYRFNFS